MTRTARKQSSTDIYHVMVRGVNRRIIFEEDEERQFFVFNMRKLLSESVGEIYAWCLMDNHVHLLVKMSLAELSTFMQRMDTTYALYFNKRHGRSGHLFQDRFKSEPVEDDAYFLTVVRYIHQNPVKAFMTRDCRSRWSSYDEYVNEAFLCNVDYTLAVFGGLSEFLSFHKMVAFEDRCLEIVLSMSDSEAAVYASKVLGEGKLESLAGCADLLERNRCLRILKNCMLPVAQVARISNLGYDIVRRA